MKKWSLFAVLCILTACTHYPEVTVTLPDGAVVPVRVADTYKKQERAWLGQKESFDKGVLFVFVREEEQAYWRKNTQLDLDVVFIDEHHRVTQVLSPVERRPPQYSINSEVPVAFATAKYLLELPAGMAATHHITPGVILPFHLPSVQ